MGRVRQSHSEGSWGASFFGEASFTQTKTHEVADTDEVLTQAVGLDAANMEREGRIAQHIPGRFVSLSLWGDGVPYSWDRKRSVDIWTLAFPGLALKQHRGLRIPITAMPHEFVTRETQDDIMSIWAWSFQALAIGKYPEHRRDALGWLPADVWRQKKAGSPLPYGALIELKGDWKQLHSCFAVLYWKSAPHKPFCWRCNATKNLLLDATQLGTACLEAGSRLTHFEALQRIVEQGGDLSLVWGVPWLSMDALRLDWLHVADQGTTPVFLGWLFHVVICDKHIGPCHRPQ